jgi:hypothetical protein
MKKHAFLFVLVSALIFLSACWNNSGIVATPTVTPFPLITPTVSSETNYGLNNAIQILAQQLYLDPAQIKVVSVEEIDWPDSCLGVSLPDRMCAMVVTPGYKIILETQGKHYEYHTDNTRGIIVLASAPKPSIGQTAVTWESSTQPCQTAEIGLFGVAVGDCGGTLLQAMFASGERVNELKAFVNTFQAFSAETLAGKVTFTGQGSQIAEGSEQRSIAEWANLMYMEAVGGRSGAAWGSAFAWHRKGGIAGFCDDLVVYRTGLAIASSCKGDTGEFLGNFRLNSTELDQLYQYLDTYQSGEINREDNPGGPDNMTVVMTFAGTGKQSLTDTVKEELMAFASTLYFSIKK